MGRGRKDGGEKRKQKMIMPQVLKYKKDKRSQNHTDHHHRYFRNPNSDDHLHGPNCIWFLTKKRTVAENTSSRHCYFQPAQHAAWRPENKNNVLSLSFEGITGAWQRVLGKIQTRRSNWVKVTPIRFEFRKILS